MGTRRMLVAALVMATISPAALAQLNKCKDASGRISYSDAPCPGSAVPQALTIPTDPKDRFLKAVLAMAQRGDFSDFEFAEKTFGVRFQPRPAAARTTYVVDMPGGSAGYRMTYGYEPRPAASGFMLFSMRAYHEKGAPCITHAEVVKTIVPMEGYDIPERAPQVRYEVQTKGRYTVVFSAAFRDGTPECASAMQLSVGYPSGSKR